MTDRATFKYTGHEQHIRIGSETFHRNMDTLVTDPDVIAAARKHPDVAEDGAPTEPAPPAHPHPGPAAVPATAAKPTRNRKPRAK